MSKCPACKTPCKQTWCPWTVVALLGLCLIFVGFMREKSLDEKKLIKEISKTSVYIEVVTRTVLGISRSQGSGVVIESNHENSFVLTNAHVCNSGSNQSFLVRLGEVHTTADVIKTDNVNDICLLKTKRTFSKSTAIASRRNEFGDKVWLRHHSSYHRLKGGYSEIAYLGEAQSPGFRVFFGNVYPGASGSGVFNENGEVVGLVRSKYGDDSVGGMVDLDAIRAFLVGVTF
jgi:S1-C subfamily serine protease